MFEQHYEAELRHLREAGKEFAKAHPERAAALNMDRFGTPDPYVERLFEGFAFISAQLRQKLHDDLPELTEGVVSLLWPNYMRMIPSLAILEFQPKPHVLQQRQTLASGVRMRSGTIGNTGVQCEYRSTQPVELAPIRLLRAEPDINEAGRSLIRLEFEIEPQAEWAKLDLSKLRLYLHADAPVAFTLRHYLLDCVERVILRAEGDAGLRQELGGKGRFAQAGFDAEERLWPSANTAFSGYELLQEYFAFREKFLFVDLQGLENLRLPPGLRRFTLDCVLDKALPADLRFSAANVRLFCTPIINLFELEAEPVSVDLTRDEYRLNPLLRESGLIETYSVDEVIAFNHHDGARLPYVPFSSFKHRGGLAREDSPERYYHARPRRGVSGRHEMWLALGGHANVDPANPPRETLSVRLTGSNGLLPRQALRDATITELVAGSPDLAGCFNITSPTLPQYPPTDDRFHWRLISHLLPSLMSLIDAEVMRSTLALYDWSEQEANRRRIEGVQKLECSRSHRMHKGSVISGFAIRIEVTGSHFADEGDLRLFGAILCEFFRLYVPVNAYADLTLRVLPRGTELHWRCDIGAMSVM